MNKICLYLILTFIVGAIGHTTGNMIRTSFARSIRARNCRIRRDPSCDDVDETLKKLLNSGW